MVTLPNGPLNDLMRSQLEHFAHIADRLPPHLQVKVPVPSADDTVAAHQFIAAVTEQLMSVKKSPPRLLVKKRASRTQTSRLSAAIGPILGSRCSSLNSTSCLTKIL